MPSSHSLEDNIASRELLDAILQTMSGLVVVTDADGRIRLFNPACEELTGYELKEVEGRRVWDFLVPPESRDEVRAVFQQLEAGQFPNQYENDWVTKDGKRRTITWSNSALTDEDGDVRYVIGTGVDITDRVIRESRLREEIAMEAAEAVRESMRLSEEAFSGIVDLAADAIVSVNASQEIIQFNKGAEEIFGYVSSEVIGEPLEILLPEGMRAGHASHVRNFSKSQNSSSRMGERGQVDGQRKNGEVFPAEASISKQKIDGEWVYSAVLRDVSAQREYEEKLQQANLELERSNADLEHFASVASHDLQEPLRKIRAFGDRLASRFSDDLPERGLDYLERMVDAAERMSMLIDDLLAFSRLTTRAGSFEPVDLGELVEQVISDLHIRIEQTGGRVDVGELPEIEADPLQIRQLFQNLIGNALKFHREGVPPVVTVSCEEICGADDESTDADVPMCHIRVEDNGVGFDEKYLDRIFDVFQRLHGRGVYDGTGMGLAICRKVVQRHGGSIVAKSTPGEGATFVVTLPLEQPDNTEESDVR